MINNLKQYCSDNSRIVPLPQEWNRLWDMLKNKIQKPNGGWIPSLPLILAAWYNSSEQEKINRFYDHLEWAEKEQQLEQIREFLLSLPESKWLHKNEI